MLAQMRTQAVGLLELAHTLIVATLQYTNDERLGNACVVDVQVYMKRLDSFALQSDLLFIRRRRAHVPVLFTRTLFAIDSIICMHLLLMLVCFSLSTA